ncbi:MAG: hypothetical protein AAGF12_40920, partial [Myxococcota bacterium]
PINYFDGGDELKRYAESLADDIVKYLAELGTDNRRVALEYINPTVTLACQQRGLEVIDGVLISEWARMIKSPDELACMRWAIAVAELGIAKAHRRLGQAREERAALERVVAQHSGTSAATLARDRLEELSLRE